ncbi:GH14143 [Drosophila grimshawi]|uniref:GH14143 n=1 Tax=Drosophila grimshawi TaxID=7222 RepID=B4JV91_DROGR|nr:GH14143 [Drosophila grimshawi]
MSDNEDIMSATEEQAEASPASVPDADAESKSSVVTERTEEVIPGESEKMVTETIDEDGDVVEETTEVTRKTVKRTMKITEA